MTNQALANFLTDNKDIITVTITFFAVIIALGTFIKAIFEYRLQGRQKRAEFFDKFKTTFKTEKRILNITQLLEKDDPQLASIPLIDRYYFIGLYEQIAIAVNSGLIKRDVAHYMFSYFALCCWESKYFWIDINRESYYWSVFQEYVLTMQKLEKRNLSKSKSIYIWDKITGRSEFKF
ncbi:hypothetical protein [Pontibacter vulgaris]|uniref:hypothetical protein n=1 Tax=Pontibacter vulgaris TaxID=2905679 RepID=UPI001FA72144|nr:hypothetical protein [Pontibacter vulgaris]